MSASPDAPAPRRTYGRAKPRADDDAPTLLFAAPTDSPSKQLLTRFSTKSSNWRDSLNDLDAEVEETEDEIQAARERFRRAKQAQDAGKPGRGLAAFSSSTLTEPPSSTPPLLKGTEETEGEAEPVSPPPCSSPPAVRTSRQPSSPAKSPNPVPEESDVEADPVQADSDEDGGATPRAAPPTARRSATPTRSPRPDPFVGLFDDEDEEDSGLRSPRRRVKGPSKAEMDTAYRDAARAVRERQPELLKPEPTRRPISSWMEKAKSVTASSAPSKSSSGPSRGRMMPSTYISMPRRQPDTSPAEDIRQFPTSQATPNSHTLERFQRRSSNDLRTVVPSTSSPTPAVRPRRSALEDQEDDDEILPLEVALARAEDEEQERRRWASAKQNALKAQVKARAARDSDDDDDFVIQRSVPPAARTGPSRPSTSASRHMPRIAQASNRAATAKRPAGGRLTGREIPITHARMTTELVGRHLEQAHQLQQLREEKYGGSRRLPEKRELDIGTIIPASASAEADDDSDEDDGDFAPDDEGDDGDVEVWSGAEDEAAAMPSSEHGSEDEVEGSGADDEDEDKENQPVVAGSVSDEDEDDDEGPVQLRKRITKARVAFISDDEGDEPAEKPLLEATRKPLAPTMEGEGISLSGGFGADFGGFDGGEGEGGFSQLFADTQGEDGFGEGDAFDKIREQEEAGHRLAPSAALLPSVQISESQKKRDNALIAAEFEEVATPKPDEVKKQYLNSQGFFTQTRPIGLSTQLLGSATQPATSTDMEPSSTLVNSSDRPSDPTSPTTLPSADVEPDDGDVTFTRLRRRRDSPVSATSSPDRPTPTRPRNAFDLLNAGAARQQAKAAKAKARDSALIDAQAEESDDDAGWGFVTKEADEDDEADDGYVPELVDDEMVADDLREEQDALATEKARAIAQEDDARREAEAKKVIEGHYRVKRRGNDFLSDEEDEAGPRMSKKARRQRRLDREDGLFKLSGESNVFLQAYAEDLESDNEFDEAPPSPGLVTSPVLNLSARERDALLRQRARMNREPRAFSLGEEEEGESVFMIARASRTTVVSEEMDDGVRVSLASSRSVESYTKFVSEQAANPRRNGGGGVSVVGHGAAKPAPKRTGSTASASAGTGSGSGPSSSRSLGSSSGSVLLGRGNRFG